MKIQYTLIFILSLSLAACSSKDEPDGSLSYSLGCDDTEDVIISSDKREATIASYGGGQYLISIAGDFVNIVFDSSVDWATASYSNRVITVNISRPSDSVYSGHINFTVFNDDKSASGKINFTFEEVTYENLLKQEQKAIDYFLKDETVATTTPTNIAQFQVGEDAPFYWLDSDKKIAMRIVSIGNDGIAKDNDIIIFSFLRWNLLQYYQNGVMPQPSGNANSLTDVSSFYYNDFLTPSSAQWGKGIQMPLLNGVPVGSHVQLVIASSLGFADEVSYATPYLYDITYFLPASPSIWEFPYAKVYIPFSTQAVYHTFGVNSPCTWKFFNIASSNPSNFQYPTNGATGLGGIFLIQDVNGNTTAFDASCPVECKEDVTIWLDSETGIAICKTCGSEYDVFQFQGFPISGQAAEIGRCLKEYNVLFEGSPYCVIIN